MRRFFTIAGLKILLEFPESSCVFFDKTLDAFETAPFATPDMRFTLDMDSSPPTFNGHRTLFTSTPGGLWTILEGERKDGYIISLHDILSDTKPYTVVETDRDFRNFIIFANPRAGSLFSPLAYPLDELAVSGHISINRIGLILHSACVSSEGKGILFAGVSGSGKSTLSVIWQNDKDAEVLTDERAIIRTTSEDLWAFGTPWHGTAEIHKNAGAPLHSIFFIRHGVTNRAVRLSKVDAANRLMVRCFPTFWNREGMQFALDFCAAIATQIDCYELEFLNDTSVIEYVKGLHS